MKTCCAFLLFTIAVAGQNLKPVFPDLPIAFGKTNIFNTSAYTLGISLATPSNQAVFVSYNSTTGLNDMYVTDCSTPSRSVLLLDNLYRGVKIDSFNPNGASSLEEGLASGVLNLIFNGNGGRSAYIKL